MSRMFFIFTGFYLYFFRKEVTDVVADTVSHVASKSLEDDCLLTSAQSQGKILITNIFNDIEMQNQATIFVTSKIELILKIL